MLRIAHLSIQSSMLSLVASAHFYLARSIESTPAYPSSSSEDAPSASPPLLIISAGVCLCLCVCVCSFVLMCVCMYTCVCVHWRADTMAKYEENINTLPHPLPPLTLTLTLTQTHAPTHPPTHTQTHRITPTCIPSATSSLSLPLLLLSPLLSCWDMPAMLTPPDNLIFRFCSVCCCCCCSDAEADTVCAFV